MHTAEQRAALARTIAKQRRERHARIRRAYRDAAAVGATPAPALMTALQMNVREAWGCYAPSVAALESDGATAGRAFGGINRFTVEGDRDLPRGGLDWSTYDAIAEFN